MAHWVDGEKFILGSQSRGAKIGRPVGVSTDRRPLLFDGAYRT
jgi:hypothetical protein